MDKGRLCGKEAIMDCDLQRYVENDRQAGFSTTCVERICSQQDCQSMGITDRLLCIDCMYSTRSTLRPNATAPTLSCCFCELAALDAKYSSKRSVAARARVGYCTRTVLCCRIMTVLYCTIQVFCALVSHN